jgi:phage terminase large subunit GpA-like protein
VLFLTCGVDVQKDRLMYEVVGWGRGKRSWSIDIGIIPGDSASEAPWKQIDALLQRTFKVERVGSHLGIGMLAVDSGYNTQTVYNWARNIR